MTMIAGGGDGTEKAARVLARRPTIRPRPVTPPRAAPANATASNPARATAPTWRLPPVRLPSPRIAEARAAARPVLLLVADASDQFEIALRHESTQAETRRPLWGSPRTLAVVTAAAVVLAVAALAVGWASARPGDRPPTSVTPARVAVIATAKPTPTSVPATQAPQVVAQVVPQVIPLVDVKSLPPARRPK